MKRLIIVLALVLVFALSGCDRGNMLDQAMEKMENAESYRMDMTMDGIPLFGSISMVLKADGDLRYQSSIFGDPVYSKMIDGEEYEYIYNDNDELVLSDTPNEIDEEENDFLGDIEADDFEKDGDVWVLIEDKLYLNEEETEYMTDIIITLDEDANLVSMSFTMYTEDLSSNVIMEVTDINNTTIIVPGN